MTFLKEYFITGIIPQYFIIARILDSLGEIYKFFEDSSTFNNEQFILLNISR